MKRRVAYSLIELLVVMSAASTILTLTAVALHTTMRAHTRANTFHAEENTAWRLAASLRRDLRHAHAAEIDRQDAQVTLRLTNADESIISYQFHSDRAERQFDPLVGSGRNELFAFKTRLTWTVLERDDPNRVVVRGARDTQYARPVGPPLSLHISGRLASAKASTGGAP